jgi:hypothetical protein
MMEEITFTNDEFERLNPVVITALSQGYDYCDDLIQLYTQIIIGSEDEELSRDYRIMIQLLTHQNDNINPGYNNQIDNTQNIFYINHEDPHEDLEANLDADLEAVLETSFNTSQASSSPQMVDVNIGILIKNKERLALPSDIGKCIICYDNCFEEENPGMVVPIPCGEVHDLLHVECFRNYAKTSSSCPLCRKSMSLELDTVVGIANKVISESMIQGIEASKITILNIQMIIENIIKGKTLNIRKFNAVLKFTCITSWKEMFIFIGCKFSDDESKAYLPHESKSSASLFSDALSFLHP